MCVHVGAGGVEGVMFRRFDLLFSCVGSLFPVKHAGEKMKNVLSKICIWY